MIIATYTTEIDFGYKAFMRTSVFKNVAQLERFLDEYPKAFIIGAWEVHEAEDEVHNEK